MFELLYGSMLVRIIAAWTVLGYFFVSLAPIPQRRGGATLFVLVGGPFAWLVVVCCALESWSYRLSSRARK